MNLWTDVAYIDVESGLIIKLLNIGHHFIDKRASFIQYNDDDISADFSNCFHPKNMVYIHSNFDNYYQSFGRGTLIILSHNQELGHHDDEFCWIVSGRYGGKSFRIICDDMAQYLNNNIVFCSNSYIRNDMQLRNVYSISNVFVEFYTFVCKNYCGDIATYIAQMLIGRFFTF